MRQKGDSRFGLPFILDLIHDQSGSIHTIVNIYLVTLCPRVENLVADRRDIEVMLED